MSRLGPIQKGPRRTVTGFFPPSQHPNAYYAILNTLPISFPHVLAHFV